MLNNILACRLFTTDVSAVASPEDAEYDQWQKSFKLSYNVGAAVVKGTEFLPSGLDQITSGSHLLRLCMQHQQLVAPPGPVAGQGNSCNLLRPALYGKPRSHRKALSLQSWNAGRNRSLLTLQLCSFVERVMYLHCWAKLSSFDAQNE